MIHLQWNTLKLLFTRLTHYIYLGQVNYTMNAEVLGDGVDRQAELLDDCKLSYSWLHSFPIKPSINSKLKMICLSHYNKHNGNGISSMISILDINNIITLKMHIFILSIAFTRKILKIHYFFFAFCVCCFVINTW